MRIKSDILSTRGRCKHPATRARFHHGCAITGGVRKADPPVIPCADTLHQQRVNSIDGEGAHRLQNVGYGWRARTGIPVVVGHIGIEAADALAVFLLNEDVPTVAVATDTGENHRDPVEAEMPAGRDPCWIVVHPADCDVAGQVNLAGNGFLETEADSPYLGRSDALPLHVLRQRQRLVPADILCIEALAVEVARSEEHTSELQSLRHLVC